MLFPQWSKRRKTRRAGIVVLCLCWVTFAGYAQDNEVVSISGTLLMLDDKTPSVACVVQVVKPTADGDEPTVIATTLSNENGKYQFTHFQSKA